MKRRRTEPIQMKIARTTAYFGKVIPLLSPWGNDQGKVFRIGYYSWQDGMNCVWLVNEAGSYEQTTDQPSIECDFEVLKLSTETDMYGMDGEPFGPLADAEFAGLKEA